MPTYQLTDGQSGNSFQVDFQNPPSSQDIDDAVGSYRRSHSTTAAGAFARSVGTSVVPAFGAWKGAEMGAAGGEAMFGGPEDPLADVAGVVGGLGGAIIGSIMADKAQKAALKVAAPDVHDELEKFQNEDVKQHPIASAVGDLAGSAAAFKPQNPMQAVRGLAALVKIARGTTVNKVEKQAAKILAMQMGVGTAGGIVAPLAQGQRPTISDVTQGVAQMILFGKPRFGETPSTTGEQNASSIQKTAALHGNVRPLEEPAKELPVKEGERGVQPQAEAVAEKHRYL